MKKSATATLAATAINWDGGQRFTLNKGETATCQALSAGQLYAIFLYNSSGADHDITVNVNWSNQHPPVQVVVPGTSMDQGLASVVLVSGDDTNTVSVSILQNGTHQTDFIDTWIGSVKMPTDTRGLDNQHIPANGHPQPFNKYRRYYDVPASHWYNLTINSNIDQFISIQFRETAATVFIVNPTMNANARVTAVGSVKENKDYTIVKAHPTSPQTISYNLQGDGMQYVWMNADSEQDSRKAMITLQSLG